MEQYHWIILGIILGIFIIGIVVFPSNYTKAKRRQKRLEKMEIERDIFLKQQRAVSESFENETQNKPMESNVDVDKVLSKNSLANIKQSKGVSLYRKSATPLELASKFDYIYVESFRSYREAEKETKISRFRISKSVKNGIHIIDPKSKTKYLFAKKNNNLNSTEK